MLFIVTVIKLRRWNSRNQMMMLIMVLEKKHYYLMQLHEIKMLFLIFLNYFIECKRVMQIVIVTACYMLCKYYKTTFILMLA